MGDASIDEIAYSFPDLRIPLTFIPLIFAE